VARRRKGRPVDGILVVDKPAGMTSNACLQRVKRALFAAKAGHTGSLDPLATGVLPLCFGEATKLSRFLLDADKCYTSTFVLGVTTASGDADGEQLEAQDASALTLQQVEQALAHFRGEVEQIPSMYSAIKHQGKPLYQLARAGLEVERKPRKVTIHSLNIVDFKPGRRAELCISVRCSKGTYVRSLAEDLGRMLGCGAHVRALRRTQSGPFSLEHSVSLERVEALAAERQFEALNDLLLPVDSGLDDMPTVILPEHSGYYLRQGQPVLAANMPSAGFVRIVEDTGEFLGVGEIIDDGRLAPRRLMVASDTSKTTHL
jgi:tRNA pseudouridine55 synthase